MNLDELKQGLSSLLDSVSGGWQHMRQAASSALTSFRPSAQTNVPEKAEVDDMFYIPSGTWSMLGANLFEDNKRIVVRIELPGVDKNDLDIEVLDNKLIVRGEKRFEREGGEGRYRVLQCAYGAFERIVPLTVTVVPDQATASFHNGVLRVELPKADPGMPQKVRVKIE
ncbi:MAG TPA: Hsp20/alpha crystallin family protein [Noviherbaspirillum sp.]|nr:Hsp20/alpha crystallin family protein [Noviherbaspirillum sp.]